MTPLSNEWKHSRTPRPKKVRPTQCAVKVLFIVAYHFDGVVLHHAVPPRHTGKRWLLLHFPAAQLPISAWEKTMALVGTETHNSS